MVAVKKKNITSSVKKVIENKKEIKEKDAVDIALEQGRVLSTGSTLFDLACTGMRVHGGGVPSGSIFEIFGPPSAGKTAVLVELAASCQRKGGDTRFADPEYRLDKKYAKTYGFKIKPENYSTPNTVVEMFDSLWDWQPEPTKKEAINLFMGDSLAALSTEMEMEDADKMGMKRAKDFSEQLRKVARVIAGNGYIVACSNQERIDFKTGRPYTPGGQAFPYYASLRVRFSLLFQGSKIKQSKTVNGKKYEKIIGIWSEAFIKKSSKDDPYRTAKVPIIFGYGIDDIRGNLQWLKEVYGSTKYFCFDKDFGRIDDAIDFVEKSNLENDLRELVISEWVEVQKAFIKNRKTKKRF